MSEEDIKDVNKEEKVSSPPKKKRLWLKILLVLFGLFCCLIIGVYFYISSAAFIRGQVFTRVQDKLNQPITAEGISFSPLSGLELTNFSLGDDPFVKAGKIKISYELIPMLSNNINVSEFTIEDAEMNVLIDRDGNLNILSKMVKKIEDKAPKPKDENKQDSKKEKVANKNQNVPNVNIQNINFKNLKLHVFKDDSKEEKQIVLNLENFSFSIPSIKNGEELKFELETAINCKAGEKFNLKNGLIKLSGQHKLSKDLVPEIIKMNLQISDLNAVNEGVELPLKALSVLTDIGIDGKKVTINNLAIENPERKAGVSVSGVLDEKEIDLKLAISQVDSSILDLALVPLSGSKAFIRWQEALAQVSEGKIAGFGNTVVNFTGTVKGNPDKAIDTKGSLEISSLPMVNISQKSTIVPITTKVSYDLSSKKLENTLEVKKLSIDVSDNARQLVSVNLNSPLTIDTANNKLTSGSKDQVTFKLNKFDLNLLKAFMKETKRGVFENGFISTECQLVSKDSGDELQLKLVNLSLNDLAIKKDDEIISDINITSSSLLSVSDLAKINLQDLAFSIKQGSNELSSLKASGLINLDAVEANITLTAVNVYPHIKSFIPKKTITELGLDNVNLSSEKLQVHYSKGGINAEGILKVTDMAIGGTKLPSPTSITQSTSFKVSIDETETLNIEKFDLNLLSDNNRAVALSLSGKFNDKIGIASINFRDLRVQPGIIKFLPAGLKEKFDLGNINLDSKDLKIEKLNNKVSIKGSLFSNGIALGGKQFADKFRLNQSTTVDVQLVVDQLVDIKGFNVSIQTDNKEALNLALKGTFRPGDKAIDLNVSQFEVSPGLRSLVPQKLIEKFGLMNINAKSKGIHINYTEGQAGFVKADLSVENMGIAGTSYRPFSISQALNVDLTIDKQGILKIANFHSKTKPSFSGPVEVIAKGKVDLNFIRDDSEITIEIPSVIDLDGLLKLAKEKQNKESTTTKPVIVEKKPEGKPVPTSPAPEKKKPIKMTVKTSANEVLFDNQSIKGIRATAFIDGDNYTLKDAILQVGDAVLKAAGTMNNGPTKSLSLNVSSTGPIDLAPINDILNKGTNKNLSGKVTIKQLNATSSGKTNEELTNNLKATGKLYIQDVKLSNYAQSGGMDFVLDNIIGVNPANINFQEGIMDINMENSILTLNQMDFDGKSLGFNPRGTIDLKNNTYDIRLNTAAGFAGGTFIQKIMSNPQLVNLINSKTDELKKFQERFPYNEAKKKFMLKEDFPFNKEIKLSNKAQQGSILESAVGLNSVTTNMLNTFFIEIAKQANMKEAASIVNLLNGNISKESIFDIGKGLLEKELNKKKGKENMDDNKSKDPLGGLLDILGGNKKKKEKKQEEQPKPKEEKKKEDPINKEDDLIKKIDNLLK
ncbi:MAG: hypothetical protein NE328_23470 [Lentisphaeraceae bacterium]|nr:hypothetical protein [Lentisphaeraceae bacterium]